MNTSLTKTDVKTFQVGDIVRNMGIIARIVDIHEETGDPILRELYNNGSSEFWLADAAKCDLLGGTR